MHGKATDVCMMRNSFSPVHLVKKVCIAVTRVYDKVTGRTRTPRSRQWRSEAKARHYSRFQSSFKHQNISGEGFCVRTVHTYNTPVTELFQRMFIQVDSVMAAQTEEEFAVSR